MAAIRAVVEKALERTLVVLMALMVVNVLWQVATRFLLTLPVPVILGLAVRALIRRSAVP